MTQLLRTLRHAMLALLALPLLAFASPTYLQIGGIGFTQTGLTVTDLGNGTKRWVTSGNFTNTNGFDTNEVFAVVDRQWINAVPTNASAMQWDDNAGLFRSGSSTGEADNETLFIALADTDLAPPAAVFGVGPGDSLAAFSLGSLAAGQTVSRSIDFIMTADVHTMFFNWRTVELPEPQSLALVAVALAGLLTRRRRAASA